MQWVKTVISVDSEIYDLIAPTYDHTVLHPAAEYVNFLRSEMKRIGYSKLSEEIGYSELSEE